MWVVSEYSLADHPSITISRRVQRDGTVKWAVYENHSLCLAKDGLWEVEPLPSSREEEFLARCRFDSLDEAKSAAERLVRLMK